MKWGGRERRSEATAEKHCLGLQFLVVLFILTRTAQLRQKLARWVSIRVARIGNPGDQTNQLKQTPVRLTGRNTTVCICGAVILVKIVEGVDYVGVASVDVLSSERPQSVRYQRRSVDDCSPGLVGNGARRWNKGRNVS